MLGVHQSPVNSPHKRQWRGALMFSLICAWINSWVNYREASDLRCHHAHYDIIVICRMEIHWQVHWKYNYICVCVHVSLACVHIQSGTVITWSSRAQCCTQSLLWHHNGAMASQITSLTTVYSTVHSGTDQRKHQSWASLAFMWGIHRSPVNSPHKWPATWKMFPFDDSIMALWWLRCRK